MREQPNFKHYTRGGQISFHNLRMWDQITKTLLIICLFLWVVLTGLMLWAVTSLDKLEHAFAYYYATFLNLVGYKHTFHLSYQGKTYRQTVDAVLHYSYYASNAKEMVDLVGKSALLAFVCALVIGVGLAVYFIKRGKAQSESEFVRGSRFKESKTVKQQIIANKANSDITIDGFPLIAGTEVQHLLIHGTVGSGKSQLIMKILDALRKRGDRVIVYDKGCALIPHYFEAGQDVILNPYDARCPNWDLWQEAKKDEDFDNIAESLIPLEGRENPFFVNAARVVFSTVASLMRDDAERSLTKLLDILIVQDLNVLEAYLKGTYAATLVSQRIDKTALSTRALLVNHLKSFLSLSGLNQTENSSFAVHDYIANEEQSGWLFISSDGERHSALKPLISMWLSQAYLSLLSLKPDPNRRIWFICDELPSLHKLPLLSETIAESRKFGGCFLLGMQSAAQLTHVYEKAGAEAMFDLLNTRFYFRSTSHAMAHLVSKELGEEEIEESRENYSYGANSIRDGISLGSQRITRPIVSYAQVLELKDLHCFVRLPGGYPVTQLPLKLTLRPTQALGFSAREMPASFHKAWLAAGDAGSSNPSEQLTDDELSPRALWDNLPENKTPQPIAMEEY